MLTVKTSLGNRLYCGSSTTTLLATEYTGFGCSVSVPNGDCPDSPNPYDKLHVVEVEFENQLPGTVKCMVQIPLEPDDATQVDGKLPKFPAPVIVP
jgi:hypothetical protein